MLRIIVRQEWFFDDEGPGPFAKPFCFRAGDNVVVKLKRDISVRSRKFRETLFKLLGQRMDVNFTLYTNYKLDCDVPQNVHVASVINSKFGTYIIRRK